MKKIFIQLLNSSLLGLLIRYGIVGVVASVAHFSVAYICYQFLHINFFIAHFFGFFVGLLCAYFGHYFYSFKDQQQHTKRFPKFLLTSLVALTLHQGGAYLLVKQLHLNYSSQVLPLLVISVPLITFLLNRFWVFSEVDDAT
jgi:putative flippase GtrA